MTAPTTMQIPGFRGDVIAPDHDAYDEAHAVWNGSVDRRPRLIARCSGTADVAAAVRFARDCDLEIAVRGGGHNIAGTAVCDDGIVIDLSAIRAVSVDPVEGTALVQGGALWGDVDHETQAHGLATTGGIVGHTGVGGLSLGGGIGWLMRKHGLTVDNLIEAEVVTADGDIVRAAANDHPDLFWALRGGGGNFGVVSSFRFTLHPVGPTVMAGPVFWAAEDTTAVLRFYREFVTDAPDELGNVIRLGTIPPLPVISEELHFRPAIAVASCYAGPIEDGGRAVRALREFGTPLVDLVGPTLYVDHQSGLDDTVPHGWHYYWKATNLDRLSDEVIDIVAEHAYGAGRVVAKAAGAIELFLQRPPVGRLLGGERHRLQTGQRRMAGGIPLVPDELGRVFAAAANVARGAQVGPPHRVPQIAEAELLLLDVGFHQPPARLLVRQLIAAARPVASLARDAVLDGRQPGSAFDPLLDRHVARQALVDNRRLLRPGIRLKGNVADQFLRLAGGGHIDQLVGQHVGDLEAQNPLGQRQVLGLEQEIQRLAVLVAVLPGVGFFAAAEILAGAEGIRHARLRRREVTLEALGGRNERELLGVLGGEPRPATAQEHRGDGERPSVPVASRHGFAVLYCAASSLAREAISREMAARLANSTLGLGRGRPSQSNAGHSKSGEPKPSTGQLPPAAARTCSPTREFRRPSRRPGRPL